MRVTFWHFLGKVQMGWGCTGIAYMAGLSLDGFDFIPLLLFVLIRNSACMVSIVSATKAKHSTDIQQRTPRCSVF